MIPTTTMRAISNQRSRVSNTRREDALENSPCFMQRSLLRRSGGRLLVIAVDGGSRGCRLISVIFAVKHSIKTGQDEQCQGRGRKDPADDNCCQRALHFRARASSERHWNEAERGHQ